MVLFFLLGGAAFAPPRRPFRDLFAEERVRCVRLVEVWNIVMSPRHPSLVLACPHEQIQDEDGIGEEAVKNLDKRTS